MQLVKEDEYEYLKMVITKIRRDSASGEYFLHNNCTELPTTHGLIVYSIKICIVYAGPTGGPSWSI